MKKLCLFAAASVAVVVGLSAGTLQAAQVAKFVEYVETDGKGSTAGEYVLLDYTPTSSSVVEAEVMLSDTGNSHCLFCARGNSTSEKTFTCFYIHPDGLRWDYNRTTAQYQPLEFDKPHRLRFANDGLWVDDVKSSTIKVSPADYTPANKMMLFASYTCATTKTPAATSNYAKMRLYSFKAYDDNGATLKVDLIPCVATDGVVGLYDRVSGVIYYNKQSGKALKAGPVNQPPDMLEVTATPGKFGEPTTPYGLYFGLKAGEERTVAAFDGEWTDGATKATCAGWKLYAWDDEKDAWVETDHGTGTTCDYTHPDPAVAMKLEWQLEVSHKIVGGAAEEGLAVPAEQWVKHGQLGKVTAVSDTTTVFDWTGDTVNASAIGQDLLFQVVAPRTVTPVFAGQTLYVAETGNDETGDGTAENPFASPKKALDTIHPLFTAGEITTGSIVVGPGTYLETEQLYVTNAIRVVGSGWTNCVFKQTAKGSNQRVVILKKGAKLVGVTCTGGHTVANWEHGAGVQMSENSTLSWCCVSNNTGDARNYYGIGVNISSGMIDHCIIANNSVGYSCGAAIGYYSGGGAVTVDTCLMFGNRVTTSDSSGGALYNNSNTMTVRNCTIADNESKGNAGGGGVYFTTGNTTFENCLIADNVANSDAGAGKPNWGASSDSVKSTVSGKTTYTVWGNGCGLLGNEANSYVGNAMFQSVSGRDFHLQANSDAIGRGKPGWGLPLDLDGNVRSATSPTAGCYGYDPATQPFACTVDFGPAEAFEDDEISFAANSVNPPEGADLVWTWTLTDQFGAERTLEGREITAAVGYSGTYTVSVTAVDRNNPGVTAMKTSEATLRLGPYTNYVTCVKTDVKPVFPYDDASCAATSISDALNAAVAGTTIVLDEGTHKLTSAAALTRDVTVVGQGVDRTIVKRSSVNSTPVFSLNSKGCVVQGVTVRDAFSYSQWNSGSGVIITGNGGTLRNCRVTACTSGANNQRGLGIACNSAYGVIENCEIDSCTNTHTVGQTDFQGVALWIDSGKARNLLIRGNFSKQDQTIVYAGGGATIQNCTVVTNAVNGTAVYSTALYSVGAKIENCLFWGNQAPNNAQTATTVGAPNWTISAASAANKVKNCCWDGSDDLGSACAKKGDVQFVDPAAGDYRIRPFSTCFDAGLYDATWMDGATDLGGNPRVKGKRPDIGCYECQDVRGLMLLVR